MQSMGQFIMFIALQFYCTKIAYTVDNTTDELCLNMNPNGSGRLGCREQEIIPENT